MRREYLNAIVTLDCDSKCKHCYIDSQEPGASRNLPVEVWEKIIRDFANQGGEEVCFQGGEPLLYPGILQLIKFATYTGLRTSIITNGLNITPEITEALAACETYVLISLDGPRENYQEFRGIDGFDRVEVGIDMLNDSRIQIHPIQVVHKDNLRSLDWISNFCTSKGIPIVTLSPIQPIGRAGEIRDLLLDGRDLQEFTGLVEGLNKKQGVKFVTQAVYQPIQVEKYISDKDQLIGRYMDYMNVLADGTVVADLDLPDPRRFTLGDGLKGEMNHQVWQDFQGFLKEGWQTGLDSLRKGHAINWHEVLQRLAGLKH